MKKIIVTLALAAASIFTTSNSFAQNKEYGKYDFEVGFELPLLASTHAGKTNTPVPGFFLEARYQLDQQPIDVGVHVGLSVVKREYTGGYENYRTVPFMAMANYQFGRGERFNPYVGLGVGVAMNTIVNHTDKDEASFVVSPKVGVRCFKVVDASVGYHFTAEDYSRLYFGLGFYF